ncbi:hypothetical protein ACWD4N_47535, partial [Streptomyces sp. NPDC002586]
LRLWHGWPPDWDGPALVRRAAELAPRVVQRAGVTRAHPTSVTARRRRATPGLSPAARLTVRTVDPPTPPAPPPPPAMPCPGGPR